MTLSSQVLLTFLLNALWQVPLVASIASLGSSLLKRSFARYRHWVWTIALVLSFFIPALTSSVVVIDTFRTVDSSSLIAVDRQSGQATQAELPATVLSAAPAASGSSLTVSRNLARVLLLLFFSFVIVSAFRLALAWQSIRHIRTSATEIESDEHIASLISKCEEAVGGSPRPVKVLCSRSVHVPVTIGLIRPLIILPEQLLIDRNSELLMSAIGHEFIHVSRRDYIFNLIYELLYIPLSFHPAAALIRRRIKQTRELCCDELVIERILDAEVYARSLVKLAGSAPRFPRLSITTTVGIADADILEARIMSLLRKTKPDTRGKKFVLIAVFFLLVVPAITAHSFARKFDMQTAATDVAQETQDQARKKALDEKQQVRDERESKEFREGRQAAEREAAMSRFATDADEVRLRHMETELKVRAIMQSTLVRLAKISMEQAIQIATSQQPGKVLECSLNGEHWEEPGKLAKDGIVFYHVVILSGDDANPEATHVLVNAIDGTIFKVEKESPRNPGTAFLRRDPERTLDQSSKALYELSRRKEQLQVQLAHLKEEYNAKHPDVLATQRELDQIQQALDQLKAKIN